MALDIPVTLLLFGPSNISDIFATVISFIKISGRLYSIRWIWWEALIQVVTQLILFSLKELLTWSTSQHYESMITQLKPVWVDTITIEMRNSENYYQIIMKQQLRAYMVKVRSMYKRKDTKIRPTTVPLPNGINPGGGVNLELSQHLFRVLSLSCVKILSTWDCPLSHHSFQCPLVLNLGPIWKRSIIILLVLG